ncbi:MAG: flavohemoglobin expression-modulating QEGLA motif protein [Myxococcota bacterium]|nr:flavohemoglobin expression-modulating QEGLA motif protein [Myxococcota bacterium]
MFPGRLLCAASALGQAENRIRLLDRVVPLNLARERERARRARHAGHAFEPSFEYAPFSDAAELRAGLERLAAELASGDPQEALFSERAAELALEAALVEALGSPAFASLAKKRFPEATGDEREPVRSLLGALESASGDEPESPRLAADSPDPRSLLRVLERRLREAGSSARIELRAELGSVAAAGDGVIYVRPGARLSPFEAERVALHEVEGHVLPRKRARREPNPIFSVGSRAASEDEEGRALLLEERAGLQGSERKRELVLRHRAAVLVRAGASFSESVRALEGEGAEPERALELALRAHRGGGLAREIVYLPALVRVKAGFSREPALEAWLERGRVSLAAARTLSELQGSVSINTGA